MTASRASKDNEVLETQRWGIGPRLHNGGSKISRRTIALRSACREFSRARKEPPFRAGDRDASTDCTARTAARGWGDAGNSVADGSGPDRAEDRDGTASTAIATGIAASSAGERTDRRVGCLSAGRGWRRLDACGGPEVDVGVGRRGGLVTRSMGWGGLSARGSSPSAATRRR
jgi:hypothetical protein